MTNYTLSVAQERNGKTYWTRVGTMFPMKGKDGFNLIFSALPIPSMNADGVLEVRVTAFPPKDDDRPAQRGNGRREDDGDSVPF